MAKSRCWGRSRVIEQSFYFADRGLASFRRKRLCGVCGKGFKFSRYQPNRQFCSEACVKIADKEKTRQRALKRDLEPTDLGV